MHLIAEFIEAVAMVSKEGALGFLNGLLEGLNMSMVLKGCFLRSVGESME